MQTSMTTTALLEHLADPANQEVWQLFDSRYRPIISAFARRLGLSAADAADAAQETLLHFVRDYRAARYDRSRGRLSAWLIGIARHRIAEMKRRRAARREHRGESAFIELPDDGEMSRIWDDECRRALLCQAIAELSRTSRLGEQTLQAFRMQVIDGRAPADIAAALGLSVRSVYLAKHRCLGRLRGILEQLQSAYEFDSMTEPNASAASREETRLGARSSEVHGR